MSLEHAPVSAGCPWQLCAAGCQAAGSKERLELLALVLFTPTVTWGRHPQDLPVPGQWPSWCPGGVCGQSCPLTMPGDREAPP